MAVRALEKKNVQDLEKDLKKKREQLKKTRFGFSGSKTRNTKEGENLRKDIARILTELKDRSETK